MKTVVVFILAALLSGCMSYSEKLDLPDIVRPITVISCEPVLERTDCLTFITADKRKFELEEGWYGDVTGIGLRGSNYDSGKITRNMPIRTILIDCLQGFVDSRVTPAQMDALYARGQTDYSSLNKEEINILGAKGYIESLKRINEKANK